MQPTKDIVSKIWIDGSTEWLWSHILVGWIPYYVNFMFHPLRGNTPSIISQMHRGIQYGFYARFCTEFVHQPRSRREQLRLPRMLLFPDLPVFKYDAKHPLCEVTINEGGLHFNGHLLIPPVSRFSESVVDHIRSNPRLYLRRGISRIHVKVADQVYSLSDYAGKSIKRRIDPEHILVLPRALNELDTRPMTLSPADRRLKELQSRYNFSTDTAQQMSLGRSNKANR